MNRNTTAISYKRFATISSLDVFKNNEKSKKGFSQFLLKIWRGKKSKFSFLF